MLCFILFRCTESIYRETVEKSWQFIAEVVITVSIYAASFLLPTWHRSSFLLFFPVLKEIQWSLRALSLCMIVSCFRMIGSLQSYCRSNILLGLNDTFNLLLTDSSAAMSNKIGWPDLFFFLHRSLSAAWNKAVENRLSIRRPRTR